MLKRIIIISIAVVLAITGTWLYRNRDLLLGEAIKVGILHSLTGTMAISEKSVVDSTLMAIEEINQQGGVLGRKIEPVVVDGRSDESAFAEEAERLIVEEGVSVVFGCWTSASRKAVKPVFEKYDNLLFYPVQYEGLEESANIIYTGASPNQQIIPAVKWCFDNFGSRFFLVGSDYIFPRIANEIIKDVLTIIGGDIAGEEYIPVGSDDVSGMIKKIIETKPAVILNTINGDSNIHFFRELRDAGISSDKIPTMSLSIAEDELRIIGAEQIMGDYVSWNYFQCLETDENKQFVKRFKERYGSHRVVDDPMEAGYFGVYLWAQAVKEAGTPEANKVLMFTGDQSYNAPGGMVCVNPENNHVWKTVRIGKVRRDGQFNIVWSSEKPIRPAAYPPYRSKSQWDKLIQDLYDGWGGKWSKSGQ